MRKWTVLTVLIAAVLFGRRNNTAMAAAPIIIYDNYDVGYNSNNTIDEVATSSTTQFPDVTDNIQVCNASDQVPCTYNDCINTDVGCYWKTYQYETETFECCSVGQLIMTFKRNAFNGTVRARACVRPSVRTV